MASARIAMITLALTLVFLLMVHTLRWFRVDTVDGILKGVRL